MPPAIVLAALYAAYFLLHPQATITCLIIIVGIGPHVPLITTAIVLHQAVVPAEEVAALTVQAAVPPEVVDPETND